MKTISGTILFLMAAACAPMSKAGEFVVVPSGDFKIDRVVKVGNEWPLLTNTVYVSAFEMARFPVTKTLWDEVRSWALTNGYTVLPVGKAKAPDHPVRIDRWHHAIQWCNARSKMEGLAPVYYTASNLVTEVTTQAIPLGNDCVRWGANGYRLPTDAEFWKAFRGGLEYSRFPWGDEITHSNANYISTNNYAYDVSETRGYHPAFVDASAPALYTSPVGYFGPNGYGLYDMAGNTRQFVWDRARYSTEPNYWTYLANPPRYDPKGLGVGDVQFSGGGHWDSTADLCRAFIMHSKSFSHDFDSGIRLVRSLPPEITNPVADVSGFRFDVVARWEPGLTIQSRTNLLAGDWDDIASTNIQAGSNSVRFLDSGAQADPMRFYRVLLND